MRLDASWLRPERAIDRSILPEPPPSAIKRASALARWNRPDVMRVRERSRRIRERLQALKNRKGRR